MLEKLDLNRRVKNKDFKEAKDQLEIRLSIAQRRLLDLKIPVAIVFEGWEAAGKGTLINDLIQPMDPRGFKVHSTITASEEESLRPFLWRFWIKTPAKGRIAIFDRSWYQRVLTDRVEGKVKASELAKNVADISSFEKQLIDDGTVIIKFFLHISREEQKKRFHKLRNHKSTAWRVTSDDLKQNKSYKKYLTAIEDMLAATDVDSSRWTVVEAHNHKYATLKVLDTVVRTFEQTILKAESQLKKPFKKSQLAPAIKNSVCLSSSILDRIDLSLELSKEEYSDKLKKKQAIIRDLEHMLYIKRIPLVIVYEGWDAAGKGGNIRRLTSHLDPRGYEVVPVAAPNDTEKAHHYLWRFWNDFPKAGHIAIFDRSWYGRVLVERVENFCSAEEWRRAYREINEMEEHMANFGAIVLKFWLHIDPDEQLKRLKARQAIEYKKWKITNDDWRNREKHEQYKDAVDEMLLRTSTLYAPWVVVESNNKLYARIKVIDEVIKAIKARI